MCQQIKNDKKMTNQWLRNFFLVEIGTNKNFQAMFAMIWK